MKQNLAHFIVMIICIVAVTTRTAAAAPGVLQLTPVMSNGDTIPDPQTCASDFGTVNQGATTPIDSKFVLRNNNSVSVSLERIVPSCGCTSAVLGEGDQLPVLVAPGKEIVIHTQVDPQRLYPGAIEKSVSLYLSGQSSAAATLIITGALRPAISVSPDLLNFGSIAYGDQTPQLLTLTVDNRVLKSLSGLTFNSSDSDMTAKQTSVSSVGPNTTTVVYAVRLSATPYVGVLTGTVSFSAPNADGGNSLVGSPIPLQGDVIGGVSCSPEALTFASVVAGQSQSQHILLTGILDRDIPKTKLFSASPVISVELQSAGKSTSVKICQLNVTVDASMQPGSLQTQVIVTTPDGERLLIPIYVFATQSTKP